MQGNSTRRTPQSSNPVPFQRTSETNGFTSWLAAHTIPMLSPRIRVLDALSEEAMTSTETVSHAPSTLTCSHAVQSDWITTRNPHKLRQHKTWLNIQCVLKKFSSNFIGLRHAAAKFAAAEHVGMMHTAR